MTLTPESSHHSVRKEIHSNLLQVRCQERVADSQDFEDAWALANEKQKQECIRAILDFKINGLKLWIETILQQDLWAWSFRQLRQLASSNHVTNYSRMSKAELVSALEKKGLGNGRSSELSGVS